jgi:excisionase family DNA binding protein
VKASKVQPIESDIMNVSEAAKYLRVSESIIRRLVKQTRIPYFKIEGRYLFYRLKLVEWINSITISPSGQNTKLQSVKLADAIWERKEAKQ